MSLASLFAHYTPVMANIGLLSLVAWMFSFRNRRFRPLNHGEGALSRVNLGLLFGTAAILVMLIPFQLREGVFADTRGVLLLAAGLIGGWLSALVSALMAAGIRYLMGGEGAFAGVLYICVFAATGVAAHRYWLSRHRFQFRVWQVLALCVAATLLSLSSVLLLPEALRYPVFIELYPPILIANTAGAVVLAGFLAWEDKRQQIYGELETSQRALKHNELVLRGVLDSMPAQVALVDNQGVVKYVNSAWERFEPASKTPEQGHYLGVNYLDVCRLNLGEPDYEAASQVLKGMEKLLGPEAEPFEQIYPCHSPSQQRWFKLIANPVSGVPGVSAVTLHLEVTELILAQMDLEREKERAESANVAKTLFLSSMSHELTTPLHSILGFAQLLSGSKEIKTSPRQRESLQQILDAGKTLLELVTDVLDFSKIELGKDHPRMESVPLGSVIDNSVGLIRYEIMRRNIQLKVDTGACDSLMVRTDPRRLRQVLVNLLTNAIKYSPDDAQIRLSCRKQGDSFIRILVKDHGMGIPAHRQQEVFEPFSRVGKETGNIQGSGIGLTIARRMMESMGGTIDFDSREGEGSCFWIDVPCQVEQRLEV
ncbi:MAG: sensor histidine kinase [Ketobacteraceae bacterium]|nr:sensor histidine kinase [Ketobacteraceae bacterium]